MLTALLFKAVSPEGEIYEEKFELSGPSTESLVGFAQSLGQAAFELTAEQLCLSQDNAHRLEMYAREENEEDFNALFAIVQRAKAFADGPVSLIAQVGRKDVNVTTYKQGLGALALAYIAGSIKAVQDAGALEGFSTGALDLLNGMNAEVHPEIRPAAATDRVLSETSAYAKFRAARPDLQAPTRVEGQEDDDEIAAAMAPKPTPIRMEPSKAASKKK